MDYSKLLSDKVQDIKPSGIRKFFDMLSEMKDVVGLTVGQPDFPTPYHISNAAVESITKNKTYYTSNSGLIELINPTIIAVDGEQEGYEGCLSVPGQSGIVKRPMTVTVRALDRHGRAFELTGTELLARAFCHELDHLDGKLYVDIATDIEDN